MKLGGFALDTYGRYSLGFYAVRIYSLTTAVTVLLVLLSETTMIYARLATAIMRQQRERKARQVAMDAMAASIAHEVNQPLAAILANADAALGWLTRKTPDLDEVHAALQGVVDDGRRAAEVIRSVRTMFKGDVHGESAAQHKRPRSRGT